MTLYEHQKVLVFNKFDDVIAEGFVSELTKTEVIIKEVNSGELISILRRHIKSVEATEVRLTIIGSSL
jgi:hypothetical protein